MALFKFRKGRDEQPPPVAPAPTVEAVRRRAMHRLIGAAVLVLAAVIGFPMIFDSQPRPIPVDLPIEIVDKNRVKPLVVPPATPLAGAASAPGAASGKIGAVVKPADPDSKAVTAAASGAPAATASAVEPARTAAEEQAADARALDARKARALLEGKVQANVKAAAEATAVAAAKPAAVAAAKTATPDKAAADDRSAAASKAPASDDRFVVQVGAFADQAKVREVRRKVEAAGLKTYTQVVGTSEGDRTRVRVGPFTDKADAVRAAEKIRKLDLTAAILTL